MKKVYICSPLKGDIENNIIKARGYCRDVLFNYGCIPIAPHIYFTQFLDDTKETERLTGMKAGMELLPMCDEIWVYGTPSEGMKAEIDWWKNNKETAVIYKE